jgi:glycine hydroxymethyltransferase
MSFVKKTDPQIAILISREQKRQQNTLMMIPSENYASRAVEQAVGSCFSNKYAEGYPEKRYYQGQEHVDALENLVINRAKKAFDVPHVNVQPLSGSPANLAVYLSILQPKDKIMGLSLAHGGHLTHGASVSATGQYYQSISYILGKNGQIDYQLIEKMALKHKPELIVAGITAYPRQLNWQAFAKIADNIKAYLLADISHLAGLVVAGVYPSPAPFAHVITTTTHKTLRGPRGALIMVTKKGLRFDPNLDKKINRAVFPGLQGGPHLNSIAGIGVALKESQKPGFKIYASQIIKNSKILAKKLKKLEFRLVAGGSDTHLILVDLRNFKITGNLGAEALEAAGIVVNKNSIPFDPNPPFYPSGLRLGTPAITSRGMKEKQMEQIAIWIKAVINQAAVVKKSNKVSFDQEKKKAVRQQLIAKTKDIKKIKAGVKNLCQQFPIKTQY